MGLLIRWLLNTLALFVVAYVLRPHISYASWASLAVAAAVLGVLNTVLRPVLFLLTLPVTVLTLGLFLIVLNAIMLSLTSALVPGFRIESFGWSIAGALLLSLVSLITDRIGRRDARRE